MMERFKAIFSSLLPVLLVALTICNVVTSCKISRSNNPTEIVHTVVVTNVLESVSTVTNLSSIADNPFSVSNGVPVSLPPVPKCVCTTSYQYFLSRGRIGCQMFGRYYYDGSPTSYGVIYQIYPDRILLKGGDWISNDQRFSNGQVVTKGDFTNERSAVH